MGKLHMDLQKIGIAALKRLKKLLKNGLLIGLK